MILHWEQLVLYYGGELSLHRSRFDKATQTTYGLLCCRLSPNDYQLTASSGEHAEQRLLQTDIWRDHVLQAIGNWEQLDTQIVTTIAINRSPCRDCTNLLINALKQLHQQFPLRAQRNRFILASRGAYEDRDMINRTTQNDLIRLRNAGWELCVLQVGSSLSDRGQILQEGIERITGRGHVRLSQ